MATDRRIIDANAAVELLRSLGSRDYRREKGTIADAIKMLSTPACTPTVDAVEVVRCGKCIHAAESISVPCAHVCNREGNPCYKRITYADFGCLYGERRTDNER